MPDTATARIADFASAAAIDHGADWMITLWRGRPLYLGDLAGVLERLREACDDCAECPCGAWLCRSCEIGEPARCDDGFDHCCTFECLCRRCAVEAGDEERADRAYMAARGK